MPLSCCAPDMRSMRNGGDEAPKMQAAHRQVGRKDLQRPSYILTRNEGIFTGIGPDLLLLSMDDRLGERSLVRDGVLAKPR